MVSSSNDFASQLKRPGQLTPVLRHTILFPPPKLLPILLLGTHPRSKLIVAALQNAGYSVVLAESATGALEYLSHNRVALALLDRVSSAADPPAQLRALRSVQPDVPVIAITSRQSAEDVAEWAGLGLSDYLTQPLDLNDLCFRIAVALSKQAPIPDAALLVSTRPLRQLVSTSVPPTPPPSASSLQPHSSGEIAAARSSAIYLAVYALGPFKLTANGKLVCDDSTAGQRTTGLLKYLSFNLGRRVSKECIASLLWPDLPSTTAANNLRGTLHSLRQLFTQAGLDPNQFIYSERGHLCFAPGDDYYYDVQEFSDLLMQASDAERVGDCRAAIARYEQASALYQGKYLELDEGVEWIIYERGSLGERFVSALIRLADLYIETAKYEQAATIARRVIHEDWRREAAHRILMAALYKLGERNQALQVYQNVVDTFREELGISPMQQTRALAAHILREEEL